MIHHAADMPAHDAGFNRLVAIVTRDGVLDPNAIMVCEPHSSVADDPGCKYAPERRAPWYRGICDWLLEVFSDGN